MNLPSSVEPSDIVLHPRLRELFIVSDDGWLFRMQRDGSEVRSWYIGGDLEGVCIARPESNLIYVAVEVPYLIHEFDFERGVVTRTFDLSPWIQTPWNLGIEALTFVSASESGIEERFLVGVQADGRILEFLFSLDSESTHVTFRDEWIPVPGRADVSALSYDATHELLYILYDSADILRAVRLDGSFVNEWYLPGIEQEGVAIDSEQCELYICDDTGPVTRYSNFSSVDSDGDGVPDCRDRCPDTPPRAAVDGTGCSCDQHDSDRDGIHDCDDFCDGTPWPEVPDSRGCSCSQLDSDLDGVSDCLDRCPDTRPGGPVDEHGCPRLSPQDGEIDPGGSPGSRDEPPGQLPE